MKNRNAFTLVELLAVVVILGIIMMISIPAVSKWIDRGKEENKESMKKTLVMTTQSYAQANKTILPKAIGESVIVQAQDLKRENYLKEELRDSNKKNCMSSYVKIYKFEKNEYKYTPYIYCEGEDVVDSNTSVEPTISISFESDSNGGFQNVSALSFKATISGGQKGEENLKIDGYSYSISVRYNTSDQLLEIYNSGSLSGSGQSVIVLEKQLSEYTDITTVNEFVVIVKAFNSEGGYKEARASSSYKDTTPPTCGTITGQAPNDESYLRSRGSTRTISVLCSDNEGGSGCVKEKYTKTFDTQMEFGYITISDNAGNTTDCKVRVNIDWTTPTCQIIAYKRNSDGSKGAQVGSITANHSSSSVSIGSYTDDYGNDHWLNFVNYRYGVIYEVISGDNVHINQGKWFYNNSAIYNKKASNLMVMTAGAVKTFTATDNKTTVYLSAEGLRRGKYECTDKANNKVTINIEANIDKTIPTCGTKKTHLDTEDGVTIDITCSDGGSKCSSSNTLKYTGQKKSTTYYVNDNAGNTGSCGIIVSNYQCHPYDCNCSSCYYGENTCRYGCDTCTKRDVSYEYSCNEDGVQCVSVPIVKNVSYDCRCSSCKTGHNTCRYGCDTCYKTCYK